MTVIKYHFCPNCGGKVRGRFSHNEQHASSVYHIYKFNCWRYVGFDEYELCALFSVLK